MSEHDPIIEHDESSGLAAQPAEREVFRQLVTFQDDGMDVALSRDNVAEQFGLDVERVKEIEELGISESWPPLEH